ncbi:MAG: LD-carboxypeptidase [Clostridiales Family XIII bacterium]|jgi:muramoyltetrapeptide carboxypeptidase LdcA involved in peptidoglycan recycling|nr:LD-carboxypeptidase [Clostridiales Family XIII bacterium]
MKKLIKPAKLSPGDKVATVSLSWGGAGDETINWRYAQGKERLERLFGLEVAEMPHTLASPGFVYDHPEARAADLMAAFADPSIKAVFSCIGGDDTIRLLPYIDFDVIRNNPKILMGYSDTTVNHFMCYKAGLSSIYGPAILSDFAENVQMPQYTVDWTKKMLFSVESAGEIPSASVWTSQFLEWVVENKNIPRAFESNTPLELIQGSGKATGQLTGGCIDVIDWLRGTELFPAIEDFDGAILFFETSEEMMPPGNLLHILRALGAMGVLKRVNGIVFGKPYNNKYYDEYKPMIVKALAEFGRSELPVLYNLSFGHCEPKFCIPFGAVAEIDCERKSFSILESGVA